MLERTKRCRRACSPPVQKISSCLHSPPSSPKKSSDCRLHGQGEAEAARVELERLKAENDAAAAAAEKAALAKAAEAAAREENAQVERAMVTAPLFLSPPLASKRT